MELKKLLETMKSTSIVGSVDMDIGVLAYDSRDVVADTLFFALPGAKADGFDFIPQAVKNGAVAVVCKRLPDRCPAGVCFIQTDNVRLAMALIAAEFYGQPTLDVPVIGVTGTNGKTTITYLLESILRVSGFKPAVFGTVEYRFEDQHFSASHTTPEAVDLMRMMAGFRRSGADALILEVSSHALEQHRVDGIHFDLTIFTNLTQDHLDYHLTLDSYFNSKKRLFAELLGEGSAVINSDDDYGRQLLEIDQSWTSFGVNNSAAVHPLEIEVGRDGINGTFFCGGEIVTISSGMIGHFNVSNLMAAMAAAWRLGLSHDHIAQGIATAPQVPGRVEKIENPKGVLALVDYAHTGDALTQVLTTLVVLDHRRLVTVVGCGGDRDPGKRPLMACAAAQHSNLAVYTSDNPRTEDPDAILEQMRKGALDCNFVELNRAAAEAEEDGFIVIPERRTAIEVAAGLAKEGDLLLVAGKGHEDYQILGTTRIHFDDREELRRVFDGLPAQGAGGKQYV